MKDPKIYSDCYQAVIQIFHRTKSIRLQSGGAVLRGVNWNNGSNAGAFTLNLNNLTTNTNIGFRCVGGRWQTWETV